MGARHLRSSMPMGLEGIVSKLIDAPIPIRQVEALAEGEKIQIRKPQCGSMRTQRMSNDVLIVDAGAKVSSSKIQHTIPPGIPRIYHSAASLTAQLRTSEICGPRVDDLIPQLNPKQFNEEVPWIIREISHKNRFDGQQSNLPSSRRKRSNG